MPRPTKDRFVSGIHWVDEAHKVFRDHDGDIVVSIHDQRMTKKDVRASKRHSQPLHGKKAGRLDLLKTCHGFSSIFGQLGVISEALENDRWPS